MTRNKEAPTEARTPRVTASKADLDACTVGGARPHGGPVFLAEYDDAWPQTFAAESERIREILGLVAVTIEHVGSTSVPGLAAKPIIDIVMEVQDSSDESSYVVPLESNGYELRIREPDWYEHRVFKGPAADINLHVFTRGCSEVTRMLRFRNHLRTLPADRLLYENTKRQLASREWAYIQNYADAKTEVIASIMSRTAIGDSEE